MAAEFDDWMARWDADFEREQAERHRQRDKSRVRYDAARLDLLERNGNYPRNRRETFLHYHRGRRIAQVEGLHLKMVELQAQVRSTWSANLRKPEDEAQQPRLCS